MIHVSCLPGEVLEIGDNVKLTVLEINGDEIVLEIESSDGTEITCGEEALTCCAGAS